MDWIFDNFQIVIIVLLGVASAVKSMLDSVGRKKVGPQTIGETDHEVPLDQDKSYRKVLSPPKFPQVEAPVPPPLPQDGYVVEAAEEAAKVLLRQQQIAARLRQIRETKATTTGGANATRARIAATTSKPKVRTTLTLSQRLRSRGELRRAFVMSEILAPPVALRTGTNLP